MKEQLKIQVYDTQGKTTEEIVLDPEVFDGRVNTAVIYQVVNAYRANQRRGLAATKTRGEVSGGGIKPWRQKGTGRARVGSSRNPLWRKGGVVFGPHPRDFSVRIPAKIKTLALRSSLNAKAQEKNLVVVNDLKLDTPKSKLAGAIITRLNAFAAAAPRRLNVLVIIEKPDENIRLAFRNLKNVRVNFAKDVHCYDVLSSRTLVVTKHSLHELVDRLKKK